MRIAIKMLSEFVQLRSLGRVSSDALTQRLRSCIRPAAAKHFTRYEPRPAQGAFLSLINCALDYLGLRWL